MKEIKMTKPRYIAYDMGNMTIKMPVTAIFLIEGVMFLCAGSTWYSYDMVITHPQYSIVLN